MSFKKVNNLNIYYELEGEGQPVVFISGMTMNHLPWKVFQVPAFSAAGYQCLLFDNRDTGQTGESTDGAYSIRQLADDTVGLINGLGLQSAHIIGYSMGGMIAQEIAINHPDHVRSLTLLGSLAKGDAYSASLLEAIRAGKNHLSNEDFWTLMSTYILTWRFHENAEMLQRWRGLVTSDMYYQSPEALSRQIDAILAHDSSDRLGQIDVPTHIVVGEEDRVLPVRYSEVLKAHIPDSRLTLLPKCGHSGLSEGAATFNPAALEFMAQY